MTVNVSRKERFLGRRTKLAIVTDLQARTNCLTETFDRGSWASFSALKGEAGQVGQLFDSSACAFQRCQHDHHIFQTLKELWRPECSKGSIRLSGFQVFLLLQPFFCSSDVAPDGEYAVQFAQVGSPSHYARLPYEHLIASCILHQPC